MFMFYDSGLCEGILMVNHVDGLLGQAGCQGGKRCRQILKDIVRICQNFRGYSPAWEDIKHRHKNPFKYSISKRQHCIHMHEQKELPLGN